MKYLNNFKSFLFAAVVGMFLLTACEGSDIYNLTSPDWLSEMGGEEEEQTDEPLVGMMDDVYDIGNTDLTAGFFTLGKTYVVPAGAKWNAQFKLTVNPDNKYYKNFYLVINAVNENGELGGEYGVIRYDNDPSKNSEWNTESDVNPNKTEINRDLVGGNFSNSSPTEGDDIDVDPSVQNMNGIITLTVDRAEGGLFIKMTNGQLTKTYTQTTPFPSTGADVPLAFRVGVEGSYVGFLSTNIEPIGGCTSKEDKQPTKLELANVPETVSIGTTIEEAFAGVTGTVTFDGLPAPVSVTAKDLIFESIPDFDTAGEKTLIAMYNKTYKGANADKPVVATAKFLMVASIQSIEVTKAPSTMYFYKSAATQSVSTRNINLNDIEVTATYEGGNKAVVKTSELTFSRTTVPTTAGNYNITITTKNGKTATTQVEVKASTATTIYPTPSSLGADDNTSGWTLSDFFSVASGATVHARFTNYCPGTDNWFNWIIEIRGGDHIFDLRADNFGWSEQRNWDAGTDPGFTSVIASGAQANWATWLAAMNGADCDAYITNCGNGFCDAQVIMKGTDSNTYYQYYLDIPVATATGVTAAFGIDHSHISFYVDK